jgi:hypothetical protein
MPVLDAAVSNPLRGPGHRLWGDARAQRTECRPATNAVQGQLGTRRCACSMARTPSDVRVPAPSSGIDFVMVWFTHVHVFQPAYCNGLSPRLHD